MPLDHDCLQEAPIADLKARMGATERWMERMEDKHLPEIFHRLGKIESVLERVLGRVNGLNAAGENRTTIAVALWRFGGTVLAAIIGGGITLLGMRIGR